MLRHTSFWVRRETSTTSREAQRAPTPLPREIDPRRAPLYSGRVPELFDRERRLELELPLRLAGSDDAGAGFEESVVTLNVSGGAVCFESARRLEVGQALDLEVTIPEGLRRHFGGERLFRTRSVVYRVEPASDGRLRVVARFVGR